MQHAISARIIPLKERILKTITQNLCELGSSGQCADADGWEWECGGAAGLLAVWGEIPADTAGRSSSLLFGASDGVEQKFTGQVRDSETGMDFFPKRYYASAVGRFTSPDPMNLGADSTDPQTW